MGISGFMSQVVIPVILGIAFLAVVWNTVRFFIIGADNEESQQNAKTLAFYSVAAFVFILAFWGIVNILISGTGLPSSDVPCEDKQSDYLQLQNNKAPCVSVTNTSGVTISAAAAPTGSVGAAGGPIPTSSTGATTGATSFDTNGNAITVTTLGDPEKIARDTDLVLIKSDALASYNSQFETLYGANKDVVANTLFPDLITANPSTTDLDRLRGSYRLTSAGTITTTLLNNYLAAIQAYNTQTAHPELNQPLTYNNVSNVTLPLPASVTTNIASSKNAFALAINNYNIDAPSGTSVPDTTLRKLFDTTLSTTARVANLDSLIHSNFSTLVTPDLRDTFLQNINTENAFAGNFSNPQI
jgi:hypothetical protein